MTNEHDLFQNSIAAMESAVSTNLWKIQIMRHNGFSSQMMWQLVHAS